MSYQKPEKDLIDQPKVHRIRITLTSRNVSALEKVCSELSGRAKSKSLPVKGPVRLPTKTLQISTRKTPNGEGSKTWDKYEMRIHKRLIEYEITYLCFKFHANTTLSLTAPTEAVKAIIIN
ncbi:uncharacterized protein TRUGW13939_05964, partial [Talaromyces rugulosus]